MTAACTHFIGFRDGARYQAAVRVFGQPDFIHRVWDFRALGDIAPGDLVVFAKGDDSRSPSPFSFDDSSHF